MKFEATYAHFCDDNELPRIDATPEDHVRNLDAMASALREERAKRQAEVDASRQRCPADFAYRPTPGWRP